MAIDVHINPIITISEKKVIRFKRTFNEKIAGTTAMLWATIEEFKF
jgi:hypothetical protein